MTESDLKMYTLHLTRDEALGLMGLLSAYGLLPTNPSIALSVLEDFQHILVDVNNALTEVLSSDIDGFMYLDHDDPSL